MTNEPKHSELRFQTVQHSCKQVHSGFCFTTRLWRVNYFSWHETDVVSPRYTGFYKCKTELQSVRAASCTYLIMLFSTHVSFPSQSLSPAPIFIDFSQLSPATFPSSLRSFRLFFSRLLSQVRRKICHVNSRTELSLPHPRNLVLFDPCIFPFFPPHPRGQMKPLVSFFSCLWRESCVGRFFFLWLW